MTGIICPSEFEYRFLDIKELKRRKAIVIKSGMGKVRSAVACHRLTRMKMKLNRILLVGFAGGLTENLKIGDIVEPDVFIEQDYCAEPFEKFPNIIRKKKSAKILKESKTALMLTQDRFLKENPYKNSAHLKSYERIACDMESYAVSYFCETAGIRYSVIKLVSDSADESADHDFLKACRQLAPKLNKTVIEALESC